jgi:hypothetical protein
MKTVSNYRKHVEECHALLRGARTPEERQMLLSMAETGSRWQWSGKRNWPVASTPKTIRGHPWAPVWVPCR